MTIIKADIDPRHLCNDREKEAAIIAQMMRDDSKMVAAYLRCWSRILFGDGENANRNVEGFAAELRQLSGLHIDDRNTVMQMSCEPYCVIGEQLRRWADGPSAFHDGKAWEGGHKFDARRLPLSPLLMEITFDMPSFWPDEFTRQTRLEKWQAKRKLKGLQPGLTQPMPPPAPVRPAPAPPAPPTGPAVPQPVTMTMPKAREPMPGATVSLHGLVAQDFTHLEQRVAAQMVGTATQEQALAIMAGMHSDGLYTLSKSSGDTTMNAPMQAQMPRRLVKVRIVDNDRALLVEHCSVADLGPFMTEDNDQMTIMQALTDYDINGAIAKHNETRGTLTDEAILKATGQDVKLRPIKLKDLTITVVAA